MKKRIGIVGLGLNNPYFYAPLLEEHGAEVAYVWDYTVDNAQCYADRFGCRVVEKVENYPDVDGVLIDSQNSDHLPLAQIFSHRNIPFFIEKPMSHSEREALEFLKQKHNTPFFSASPLRFAPTYIQMKNDLLESGENPVRCDITVYHTMKYFLENSVKKWHDDPMKSGGMMTDLGIHAVELMNMFMSDPIRKVIACSTKSHYPKACCDDNYAVTIIYQNGAIGTITLVCATDRTDYAASVITPHHAFINNMDSEYTGCVQWNVDNAYGGFKGTIGAFLNMIDTGTAPISPLETQRNFELIAQINKALTVAGE